MTIVGSILWCPQYWWKFVETHFRQLSLFFVEVVKVNDDRSLSVRSVTYQEVRKPGQVLYTPGNKVFSEYPLYPIDESDQDFTNSSGTIWQVFDPAHVDLSHPCSSSSQ